MEAKCSFGLLLEQQCHKLSYTRTIDLKELAEMANDTLSSAFMEGRVVAYHQQRNT